MSAPVLFLIFNRPDTTARVFAAIRQARPSRLYIAADGPRKNRLDDNNVCAEARDVTTGVDWPCEVKTLFRAENLGCRTAISTAISWFFQHESEGIILEDDCLPHADFFPYCTELLERYRADPRVVLIGGTLPARTRPIGKASYSFTAFGSIWGWATWRRTWQTYERLPTPIPPADARSVVASVVADPTVRRYWADIFRRLALGQINTWDYQLAYQIWRDKGLAIQPNTNLISNLGCYRGTHASTIAQCDPNAERPIAPILPMTHPAAVIGDLLLDEDRMRRNGQRMSLLAYACSRMRSRLKWIRSKVQPV